MNFSDKAKDTWQLYEIESISDNSELLKFLMKKKNSLDMQMYNAVCDSSYTKLMYSFLWSYELYKCVLKSNMTTLQQEKTYSLLRKVFKSKKVELNTYYKLDKYFDFSNRAIFWKIITEKCVIEGIGKINAVPISFFADYFRFLVQFEIYLSRVFPGFDFGEHIVEDIQKDMIKLKEIIAQKENEVISEEELSVFELRNEVKI